MLARDKLIIVDEKNEILGHGSKLQIHTNGDLHRAFSVFIYSLSTGEFLLQRRNFKKYHSGGLWSNSCCSHMYDGENITDSIQRCLENELNFCIDMQESERKNIWDADFGKIYYTGVFKYFADYGEIKENELDFVYLYVIDEKIKFKFNPLEVCKLEWMNTSEINYLLRSENYFTAWFGRAYSIVLDFMAKNRVFEDGKINGV